MKIAVIGSGIAGLTSSYLLAPKAEVTLYEKDSRLGGHANTLKLNIDGKEVFVDTGFMVYNPERYPNLIALLDELGVESFDTDMSFSVSIQGEIEYSSYILKSFLLNGSNVFSLRHWRFLFGIIRFNMLAKKALRENTLDQITLGDFLSKHACGSDVASWYLYPMLGAIWSCGVGKIADFPASSTFRFLDNHHLLNVITHPTWKTIKGGSISYVEKMRASLVANGVTIKENAAVTSVTRNSDTSVTVKTEDSEDTYDYVIMATHADTTLALLKDATDAEHDALSCFEYSDNRTLLHRNPCPMPKNKNAWAAWNYLMDNTRDASDKDCITMTYNMNILQGIPETTPLFVTLNPFMNIPSDTVYSEMHYTHPQYNLRSLEGQAKIAALQGQKNIFFAGAHLGYGFHEDGLVSGKNASALLLAQAKL